MVGPGEGEEGTPVPPDKRGASELESQADSSLECGYLKHLM